jgi:hypothetical protein
MAFKVDGGGASQEVRNRNEQQTVNKPEVKPQVAGNENPASTGAVRAKQNDINYQANLRQTRLYAQTGGTNDTPPITETEAERRADEIIDNNGGKGDLNTDNAGRDLAEIARQNPSDARAIAEKIYSDDRIEGGDRDEIAQSFTQALSDDELRNLAGTRDGQLLLREIETNLLDYPVHPDESADANRIRTALDENGIFLGSEKGMYPEGVEPLSISQDPDATPEEVAAFIKTNPSWSGDPNTGRYA